MKYQLQCFDTSGCQAGFSRSDLKPAVGASLMAKLDKLQQQDEIARAGIDGLAECPFCDYKAICPPPEEDREFVCLNPKCEKTSCRLCNAESHTPKTCEEAKKNRGVSERHQVEEAMSEAFIRNCPKCKLAMVKEVGCNKMVCPRCCCISCYNCRKDITHEGYHHFRHGDGGCAMDDEGGRAHIQEQVAVAERAAIEQVRAENPDLTWEELRISNPERGRDTAGPRPNHGPMLLRRPDHQLGQQPNIQAYQLPRGQGYNFLWPGPGIRYEFVPANLDPIRAPYPFPPPHHLPTHRPPHRGTIFNNIDHDRANMGRTMNMAPDARRFAAQPNRNGPAQAPRGGYPAFFPYFGA